MSNLSYRSVLLLTSVLAFSPTIQAAACAADPKVLDAGSSDSDRSNSQTRGEVVTGSPREHSPALLREQRVSRPSEHICPITHEVMTDPVVAEDGISYEREAILRWIAAHRTSPITRQPITELVRPNQSLKKLIEEWNPHQTYRPSALKDLRSDELVERLNDEFAKNKRLLDLEYTSLCRDIVVFLGNTGAGKSTLINFLAGKALDTDGSTYKLVNADDPTTMPIGTVMFKSETLYPKSLDVGRLRFFDLPGFNDTDGSVQNLVNSAFIRQILLEANSIRFVYVAGQDQFTADRGKSITKLIQMIQQLFVTSDASADPVNQGLLIVTKEDQLIDRQISRNEDSIPDQVTTWHRAGLLERMYSARQDGRNNNEHRAQLLEKISSLSALRLSTLNVSALYPPETEEDIKRMYTEMFETAYKKKKAKTLTTVSEYESAINEWSDVGFWDDYENGYFKKEFPAVSVLRDLTLVPYQRAWEAFKEAKAADRAGFIKQLEQHKKDRIIVVQKDTEHRAEEAIRVVRSQQRIDGVVPFDFANHVEYQERVCGKTALMMFPDDEKEHEIRRQAFATWIGGYYQRQMDESSLHQKMYQKMVEFQKYQRDEILRIERQMNELKVMITHEVNLMADFKRTTNRELEQIKAKLKEASAQRTDARIVDIVSALKKFHGCLRTMKQPDGTYYIPGAVDNQIDAL